MPKSSENLPSTNNEHVWIYATPRDETRIRVRTRNFKLEMKIENDEVIFLEHSKEGIDERRFPLSEESLDWAAKHYEDTSGKWLVFRQRDQIDAIWKKICEKTRKEELGVAAKVSTLRQGKKRHVICVYTDNYLDTERVFQIREELRKFGIEEEIYYKPDIYTKLGIYSGTTSLRPWRYKD